MENAKKISSRTLAFMVIGALVLFGLGVVGGRPILARAARVF